MSEPKRIPHNARVQFGGIEVKVRYDRSLPVRGQTRRWQTDNPTIVLREWDERVFLHELLHVALERRLQEYHRGSDWTSFDASLQDPREAIVKHVEDSLWEFGWRWSA
ncbi:MAG TPA: hypothetical protein VIQ11_01390 [Mycobacterium sp.]